MDEWPGFNLLVGQIEVHKQSATTNAEIGYVSNRSGEMNAVYLPKEENVPSDGLSNSCLDQPWDKVKRGRTLLDEALNMYNDHRREGKERQSSEDVLSEELFSILE